MKTTNNKPYRVTLKTMVEVDVEVYAANEDIAKAKAREWGDNKWHENRLGSYTLYHEDADNDDDRYEYVFCEDKDEEVSWQLRDIDFICYGEFVKVTELEEEDDEEEEIIETGVAS
jgi:hypothetical protein